MFVAKVNVPAVGTGRMRRIGPGAVGMLLLSSLLTACADSYPVIPGGLDVNRPIMSVEPAGTDQQTVEQALTDYENRPVTLTDSTLEHLSLRDCLVLAVEHNRSLRRTTYRTERLGQQRRIERSRLDDATLNAAYSVQEEDDVGDGRVSVTGRPGGFEVEPFVDFLYDEFGEDDKHETNYGVAISRQVFRVKYEDIRQPLPLTQATRDHHVAINERVLELRQLHLEVVRRFYGVQRLKKRLAVRQNRVEDARTFLESMEARFDEGMEAAVNVTNARINLNQAESDLVREQTNLQNANEALLELLGADVREVITIEAEDLSAIERESTEMDADLSLIEAHHENVRNQRLQMEVQRQQLQVSKEELIPDLFATLSASREADGDDGRVALDLNLQVPLDAYREEKARARQDRLRLMELTVELADIRSDLARRLRRSYRTIDQLDTTVRLAEQRLESERNKLAARLRLYEIGADTDNLEVTRAKQEVDQAEVDLLEAQVSRIIEEARYRSLLPSAPTDAAEPGPGR